MIQTHRRRCILAAGRQLALAASLLLRLAPSHAGAIQLPLDWRAGETVTYEIETITPPAPNRPQDRPKQIHTLVTIQVVSTGADGSVHRWTFRSGRPDPVPGNEQEAAIVARFKAIGPRQVELQLTPAGEVAGVRNLEALRQYSRRLNDLELSLMANELTPRQLKILRETQDRSSSDAALLEQATGDAVILYGATGGNFSPDSRSKQRLSHPGPDGEPAVQTDASVEVSPLAADGTLTVKIVERIPQEGQAAAMAQGLNQLWRTLGMDGMVMTENQMRQSMGKFRYDVRVETEQVLKRAQRWPRLVLRREITSVDDATSMKSYRFELKTASAH